MVVTGKFFGNNITVMTIIMVQSTIAPTTGTASVVRFPLFGNYEYEASGTYDETSKVITLSYSAYDTTDSNFLATGTHVITPK